MKIKPHPNYLHHFLLAVIAGFAAVASFGQEANLPKQAAADPAGTDSNVIKMEGVSVTGSMIKRLDLEKALPVTIMSKEFIDVRQPTDAVEMLTALPQVANVPQTEADQAGSAARGDNASVNLRGIGSGNTLVLLNGRRVVPQSEANYIPGEGGLTQSANVNTLPSRGLQQLEILNDGASAIYGTDAVGGVINFIMLPRFDGTQTQFSYGFNQKGGAGEGHATLTFGTDTPNGKGHVISLLDLFHRDLSWVSTFYPNSDKTSRAPAPWNNAAVNANFFGSNVTGFYGSFQVGTVNGGGPVNWNFTPGAPAGLPAGMAASNGSFFLVPNAQGTESFQATTPSRVGLQSGYYLNVNPLESALPKTDRENLYTKFEYELRPNLTLYAEVLGYQAKSATFRENEGVAGGTDGLFIVPANSPYNPFGSFFFNPTGAPNADGTPRLVGTPSVVNVVARRFPDIGIKRDEVRNVMYRTLVGLKGRFGASSWSWDSAVFYSRSRTTDNEFGLIRSSLLQQNLNNTDPALEYNPFGYKFAVQGNAVVAVAPMINSKATIDSFVMPFRRDGYTSLTDGDFRVNGKLFSLWQNEWSLAAGLEARRDTFRDVREPFAGLTPAGYPLTRTFKLNDFNSNSPNADTDAGRNIYGLYGELLVPLAKPENRIPLVRSLELSISGRHDQYSDVGGTTKPKFSANWRPLSWLMLRGSYNQAFRAPNLAIFDAGLFTRSTSGDPFRFPVTGLPSDNATLLVYYQGNHSLKPETAHGYDMGAVIDVPFVKGLSFSIDHWQVRQTDVIQLSNGLAEDYIALNVAIAKAKSQNIPIKEINLGSGTANYQGSPLITRASVTAADQAIFDAYNAKLPYSSQVPAVGVAARVNGTFENAASALAQGLDFNADYLTPKFRLGRAKFSSSWSYLIKSYTQLSVTAPLTQRAGTDANSPEPVWRGNATLTWFLNKQWTLGWGTYYTGKYAAIAANTNVATYNSLGAPKYITARFDNGVMTYRYVVHDANFSNAFVRYEFGSQTGWFRDLSLRIGSSNVFNRTPPLSPDIRGYNINLYANQATGRSFAFDITKKY